MKVGAFSIETLRSVCNILGDTRNGLTNSEIDELLESSKIEDLTSRGPYSQNFYNAVVSKKERLFENLSSRQSLDGDGHGIVEFIKRALDPVRYVGATDRFHHFVRQLNVVLALSGLRISESGTIEPMTPASTLSEANERVSRLHEQLAVRNVHPDVIVSCEAELLRSDYFHAVLEACKSVADKTRKLSGLGTDGATLVDQAFGFKNSALPKFAFNDLSTATELDEHKGLVFLLKGMFAAFRNVPAHAPRTKWSIDEYDALDLLSLATLLHRRIDRAQPTPGSLQKDRTTNSHVVR